MRVRFITMGAVLIIAAQGANAQFLNKLKQKAQNALNKAVQGQSANNTTQSAETGSSGTATASSADGPKFNPSEYGHQVFELQPDEHIVYGEHSLRIVNNQTVVKVITRAGGKFYLYENDKRSGPYNTPPVDKLDSWANSTEIHSAHGKRTDWQPYVVRGVLTVDGKDYGQWMSISAFYHNKEKKKFYAVAFKVEGLSPAYYFITEKGTKKIPFAAPELLISDNDEHAGIMIYATQYNAKTDEDRIKYVQNDDFYIVKPDGSAIGPLAAVQASRSYLDNYGNYIEISYSRKAVYMNGKQVYTFAQDSNGNGRFFPSAKGETGAWFERGSLFFTDGTQINHYVLQPAVSVENGKDIINWLTIQDGKVYACKKAL